MAKRPAILIVAFLLSAADVRAQWSSLLGAVGAKVSICGSWLLTSTSPFPLNHNGIALSVTPVIGFERAF